MKKIRKTKKISLLFLLFLSLIGINIYAMRGKGLIFPEKIIKNEKITIGKWYMPKNDEPPLIYFDAKNPPNYVLPQNAVIYFKDKNGNISIHTVLTPNGVDPSKPNFFPNDPVTTWTRPMEYSENTAEYRRTHNYYSGDLVFFNGKIYEYTYGIPHNPNTITELSPKASSSRWKERKDLQDRFPLDELWFRYKIYFEGDVIYYKKKYYKSLKSGFSNKFPEQEKDFWQEVTK